MAVRFWRRVAPRAVLVLPLKSFTRLSKPPAAFGKNARLLTKADFRRVFDEPAKSADRYFVILGRANNHDQARLGLAISRKCARSSVDRNRIKRLIRETFRTSRRELSGIDFVVLCRPGVVCLENRLLIKSLAEHLKKVRFRLCGSS